MFAEDEFSVFDFASGISETIDLVAPELNDHHKRVAYIAYHIAREMGLPEEEIRDIALAAILHDIGAFTGEKRLKRELASFTDDEHDDHQVVGYKLLRDFEPFAKAALLIKYHHAHYDETNNKEIPLGSHVIHLADRIAILLDKHHEILGQIPDIMKSIGERGKIFHPDALAALYRLEKMEYFWIEAFILSTSSFLPERIRSAKDIMGLDKLISLAKVMSQIIDFRSNFTATHSSGVAAVAFEITRISGFSERECRLMEIAGYLHDLGKMAISNDILEKKDALNYDEFNEMRKHTYYTYAILSKIKGFEEVAKWAAYHHERLDGKGYPFHIKGENFSKLARIMAVADIMTAITEDRPYRIGMERDKAMKILSDMTENGGIDKEVVRLVGENFPHINGVRIKAQQEAQQKYNAFYGI